MKRSRLFLRLILMLVFTVAFILFLSATSNGIGVLPDSITYLTTAKNVAAGNGFYSIDSPMTHYPPLYPILLTLGEFFSEDAVAFDRFLHAFIYSLNAILFGFIIFLTTKRNYLAMIFGIAIFISSANLLATHVYVLSEPLFLTFSLLVTLFLFLYFKKSKQYLLLLTALALSLAILTRYFGVTLIPPVLLILFIFDKKALRKKILDQVLVICIAIIPVSLWMIRNFILTQSAVNRDFESHLIESQKLASFIDVFHHFFWSNAAPFWRDVVDLVILLAIISLMMLAVHQAKKVGHNVPISIEANIAFGFLFSFFYVVLLIFSISFFDRNTPVDVRLLTPVFVLFVISAFTLFFEFLSVNNHRWPLLLFLSLILLMISHNIPIMRSSAVKYSRGISYNSPTYNNSLTLRTLRTLDVNTPIYSNAIDLIYFKTGIWGRHFPSKLVGSELIEDEEFINSITLMCDEAVKNNALIVYFKPIVRWYHPTDQQIIEYCKIPILYQFKDGIIFGYSQ